MISIGLLLMLSLYNKPHLDIDKSTADLIITAQDVLDDYQKDENAANNKYVDNIIEIKGVVSNISTSDGNSIITFKGPNGISSIMCHMSPEQNLNVLKLKKDSQITIKGLCTGYLLDVIMVRCILVNN